MYTTYTSKTASLNIYSKYCYFLFTFTEPTDLGTDYNQHNLIIFVTIWFVVKKPQGRYQAVRYNQLIIPSDPTG